MAVKTRISPQKKVILAAVLSLALWHPLEAHAALKKADGERLKAIFTDMITRYENEAKAQGGSLIREGEVMVEPSDNYFAITLPHITTIHPDNSKTKIGMVSINALPGDKKDEWKMTVALPTPIVMTDAADKETATLSFGSQNFVGLFHEQFKNFVRLNGQYKNVTYIDKAENAKITIPDFTVVYDLREGANQLWSGPMSARATNITGLFNKTGNTTKIRDMSIESTIKGYSLKEATAYQERLAALMESTGTDTPSFSSAHNQGIYNMFFDYMTKVWDGFDSRITVNGMELTSPAQGDKNPASTTRIGQASLSLNGDGFRQNRVALHHTLKISDISTTPAPTDQRKALPTDVNFDIALTNLPLREIAEAGQKIISQNANTSPVNPATIATIRKLLSESGTQLTIRDSRLSNGNEYDVFLNGVATANVKAKFGAEGKARIEIFGMEKLMAFVQHAANDPTLDPARKATAQKTLATLTLMQMLGQQGKNSKGQDIRSYDIEITADGKTMLNGADLMTVMSGMGGMGTGGNTIKPPGAKTP